MGLAHKRHQTYLLEVNSEDIVYEVLRGEDVVLADVFLDDRVVGEGMCRWPKLP